MSAWERPPAVGEAATPFEIRPGWPGPEVWICVGRFANEAEAAGWIEAESRAEVAWDTLLRGRFRP